MRPENMDQYGKYGPGLVSKFDFHPALRALGCLWRYRGADRLHTPFKGKQARQSETKDTFCSSFKRGGENGGSQKTKSKW